MKKLLIPCLSLALVLSFTACGGQGSTNQPNQSEGAKSSSTSDTSNEQQYINSSAASSEKEQMLGIPGSYIKDIQLGVEKFGMEDASASGAPDDAPYRWSASRSWNFPGTSITIDYSIIGDDNSQLISGSFGTLWDTVNPQEEFIAATEAYLGFIATMPYDTSDIEASKQWVLDNIASVAGSDPITTTIGDATFTLSGTLTAGSGEPLSYLLEIEVAN